MRAHSSAEYSVRNCSVCVASPDTRIEPRDDPCGDGTDPVRSRWPDEVLALERPKRVVVAALGVGEKAVDLELVDHALEVAQREIGIAGVQLRVGAQDTNLLERPRDEFQNGDAHRLLLVLHFSVRGPRGRRRGAGRRGRIVRGYGSRYRNSEIRKGERCVLPHRLIELLVRFGRLDEPRLAVFVVAPGGIGHERTALAREEVELGVFGERWRRDVVRIERGRRGDPAFTRGSSSALWTYTPSGACSL